MDDPIVGEIRAAREQIAAEQGYDVHRLFTRWRMQAILRTLNETRTRATYGAVAEVLGGIAQGVSAFLGERRPEASWVVSAENGLPTDYAPEQRHSELETNPHIITTGEELQELMERHLEKAP